MSRATEQRRNRAARSPRSSDRSTRSSDSSQDLQISRSITTSPALQISRFAYFLLPPIAVFLVFSPVLTFDFLNWDDHLVIVQNPHLAGAGVAAWAFTTTYFEHYQPVSWLAWAAVARLAGLESQAFHALNLTIHAAASGLVFVVARMILRRATAVTGGRAIDGAALAAALLFAVHPLRAEVVAWISAFPYTLALALALGAVASWLRASAPQPPRSTLPALALFVMSLLARPVAVGVPVVLVALDVWLHGRTRRHSLARAIPFGVLAVAVAVAESIARAPVAADVSWAYRLQLAVTAPFVYLWRTVLPVSLTPLDALPVTPAANFAAIGAGVAGLGLVTLAAWRWRRRYPAVLVAWVSFLALLAPAAGLLPSGLQATADRYSYVPGVVVAIAATGIGAWWMAGSGARRLLASVAASALVLVSAFGTRATLRPWSDSVSLWTRAVAVDPASDVGLYNLGTALADAGRPHEAAARYREALTANPEHADARANLDRLDAARLEEEAGELAARGDLQQAIETYRRALELDPARTHSRTALGMALVTMGRYAEARPHLEQARREGNTEPAVANALAVLLAQEGETGEARAILEVALATHKNDVALAMNLVQVLLASPPDAGGDAALALRLASAVVETTGGRDPRIVETQAAALAANGRIREASAANARAAELARAQGDEALAVQITARGRAYRNPGP